MLRCRWAMAGVCAPRRALCVPATAAAGALEKRFIIAIIGASQSGKTTLFKLATSKRTGRLGSETIQDSAGKQIADMMSMQMKPSKLYFVDSPSINPGAADNEEGRQILDKLRDANMLLYCLRCYDTDYEADPTGEMAGIERELCAWDREVVAKPEVTRVLSDDVIAQIRAVLEADEPVSSLLPTLPRSSVSFITRTFLSAKPYLVVANSTEEDLYMEDYFHEAEDFATQLEAGPDEDDDDDELDKEENRKLLEVFPELEKTIENAMNQRLGMVDDNTDMKDLDTKIPPGIAREFPDQLAGLDQDSQKMAEKLDAQVAEMMDDPTIKDTGNARERLEAKVDPKLLLKYALLAEQVQQQMAQHDGDMPEPQETGDFDEPLGVNIVPNILNRLGLVTFYWVSPDGALKSSRVPADTTVSEAAKLIDDRVGDGFRRAELFNMRHMFRYGSFRRLKRKNKLQTIEPGDRLIEAGDVITRISYAT